MSRSLVLATLFASLLATPPEAHASGLGKFVGGKLSGPDEVTCNSVPEGEDALPHRLRFAVLGGVTAPPDSADSRFSVYLDAGYRIAAGRNGCRKTRGMFSGRNYWLHSLTLNVDAELITATPSDSPIGVNVTYDLLRKSRGFLDFITEVLPLGLGVSAGAQRGFDEWGVGAAIVLHAGVSLRGGVDYYFDGTTALSFHVGLVNPHLMVLAIVDEAR